MYHVPHNISILGNWISMNSAEKRLILQKNVQNCPNFGNSNDADPKLPQLNVAYAYYFDPLWDKQQF